MLCRETFLLKKSFFNIHSNAGQDFDDEEDTGTPVPDKKRSPILPNPSGRHAERHSGPPRNDREDDMPVERHRIAEQHPLGQDDSVK